MIRTPTMYDHHCDQLEGVLSSSDSVTYGITNRSVLNDLPYFHVANSMLPQDVMHILFEGVMPWEVKLMLATFIQEKHYFTLNELNERIKCFSYGRSEARNKPPKAFDMQHITQGLKLPLSGIRMCVYVCTCK